MNNQKDGRIMEFSQTIETKFQWWNNEISGEIAFETKEFLEGEAETRIKEMTNQGYLSGELLTEFKGVTYNCFWERNYV